MPFGRCPILHPLRHRHLPATHRQLPNTPAWEQNDQSENCWESTARTASWWHTARLIGPVTLASRTIGILGLASGWEVIESQVSARRIGLRSTRLNSSHLGISYAG